MGTYVALLRGINVGKAKRVAMADLRSLVEDLGYRDVKTLLNSGNVVFAGPARGDPAARIEKALAERCGVTAKVTVLSAAELAAVVEANPLLDAMSDPARLLVSVLRDPADLAKLKPLTKQDWSPEALALGPRVAYLWCAEGILESKAADAINRLVRDGVTARNWATMLKLHALASVEA